MTSERPSTTADASLGWSVRSVLAPSPLSQQALAGIAAVLVVGAVDVWLGTDIVLAALLALPALVVALAGRWGDTALAALLGVAIVLATGPTASEAVVVAGGGVVAIALALVRVANVVSLERFRLLVAVADASERASSPEEVREAVAGVLVPAFAGSASIGDGTGDLAVPLRVPGREIGTLALSGRRYSAGDRRFAEVLAGRVALALDNAELTLAQAQMVAVVEKLAEAVTVNDPTGQIVYANEAAVELLRVTDVGELLGSAPGAIMDRFAVYDEDGRPLLLADLPSARVLAGDERADRLLVRNVVRATGEERWLMNKVTVLRGPGGEARRVINVIEDVTSVKRAERAQRLLARASEALASSLDYADTLQAVAQVAVPELADCAMVDVIGARRTQRVAIVADTPEARTRAEQLRERFDAERDRLPAVLHDDELGRLMVVAVEAAGETLGLLAFANADPARGFGDDEIALGRELGRRAGVAVLNARLYSRRTAIAQALQHGLLPPRLPEVPGWSAAVLYRPAGELNEVGGDFYDVFEAAGAWMVVIGDIAGQGAEAATRTSLARFTARTAAELTGDVARAVERLNDTLRREEGLPLCTIVCARLAERGDGSAELTLASAGHPPPLLVRGGRVVPVGDAGVIAGAFDGETWPEATVTLEPGDVLVLYTDGVLDTVGESDRFGEQRLRHALSLAHGSVEERLAALHAELSAFQRGPQRDDTTVLVLEYRGGTGAESAQAAAGWEAG
jgi:GAF domain-containing protein